MRRSPYNVGDRQSVLEIRSIALPYQPSTVMTSLSQITVGIVGAGYMGQLRAQALLAIEGARLVAVADVDATRAEQLAPGPDSAF